MNKSSLVPLFLSLFIYSTLSYCQGSPYKGDGVYCIWGRRLITCKDGIDSQIVDCLGGCFAGSTMCRSPHNCEPSELVNRNPPGASICLSYLQSLSSGELVVQGTNYSLAEQQVRAMISNLTGLVPSVQCNQSLVQFVCSVVIPSCKSRTTICDNNRAAATTACNTSFSSIPCVDYDPAPRCAPYCTIYGIICLAFVGVVLLVVFVLFVVEPSCKCRRHR